MSTGPQLYAHASVLHAVRTLWNASRSWGLCELQDVRLYGHMLSKPFTSTCFFRITTELILKGHLFRKGQMKVSVFKMYLVSILASILTSCCLTRATYSNWEECYTNALQLGSTKDALYFHIPRNYPGLHDHTQYPTSSQPGEGGELEGAQAVFERHLVELSAVTSTGQDAIGGEMRNFADQLKPYPFACSAQLLPLPPSLPLPSRNVCDMGVL